MKPRTIASHRTHHVRSLTATRAGRATESRQGLDDDAARIDTPYEFHVQAVRHEACDHGGDHIVSVKLADGRMQTAAFAIGMIEQHDASYEFCGAALRIEPCRFCSGVILVVVEC